MDVASNNKISNSDSSVQSLTETVSGEDVTTLKSPKPISSYDSSIALQSEDDLNNKINLILSRKTTNKYDRKKVERFWKYFDKLNDDHKPTSSDNIKTETERDHCLCGTVEYKKKGIEKFTALKLLSLLKSEHLDRVVLQNAPPEHKVEGSPRLADEIFKETINTVNEDITTFQQENKQNNIEKEPVRRDIKLLRHGKNYSSILNNPCLYE